MSHYTQEHVYLYSAQYDINYSNHPGNLIATGSEDASIKVLDVNRILAKAEESEDTEASKTVKEQLETHPVIRTLYDHNTVIITVLRHL